METNVDFTSIFSSRRDILICSVLLRTLEVEGRVPRALFFLSSATSVVAYHDSTERFFLLKRTLHHGTIKFQAYSKINK